MRTLLILWFIPVSLLGLWYGLSVNDWNFGTHILSRELHDLVFNIYGEILGVAPEALPPMVFKAVAFDTAIVFSIVAFRWRKKWLPGVISFFQPSPRAAGPGTPAK